jgi:hypothetical protein
MVMYLSTSGIVACDRSCICLLMESLLPLSTILILIFDFGLVPTVWYSLLTFNHHMNIYVFIGGS